MQVLLPWSSLILICELFLRSTWVFIDLVCALSFSLAPWTVARQLLCPWDSPGKNTGVGCHAFLQGIFPTLGSNLGLPLYRQILKHMSHQGSPKSTQECPNIFTTPESKIILKFKFSKNITSLIPFSQVIPVSFLKVAEFLLNPCKYLG